MFSVSGKKKNSPLVHMWSTKSHIHTSSISIKSAFPTNSILKSIHEVIYENI